VWAPTVHSCRVRRDRHYGFVVRHRREIINVTILCKSTTRVDNRPETSTKLPRSSSNFSHENSKQACKTNACTENGSQTILCAKSSRRKRRACMRLNNTQTRFALESKNAVCPTVRQVTDTWDISHTKLESCCETHNNIMLWPTLERSIVHCLCAYRNVQLKSVYEYQKIHPKLTTRCRQRSRSQNVGVFRPTDDFLQAVLVTSSVLDKH